MNSAEIFFHMQRLSVVGSVLYVAAHPDDENTSLMSYLSTERKLRVGYLSLTRGEGGQNLLGSVLGVPLGVLREQELLQARRIDRATQFFTRAIDFGYSKEPEDTFQRWDKASVLADIVWVIRYFQPDVIVTRFPPTGEGGHGHHTASALLAEEAFTDAADKTKFPEQFSDVSPWQAKRLVWNDFRTWFDPTFVPPGNAGIVISAHNALLDENALTAGAAARSMHKTQGFGTLAASIARKEYFWPQSGESFVADPFSDIPMTWERFNSTADAPKMLEALTKNFDFISPAKSLPELCHLYQLASEIDAPVWRSRLCSEINDIIVNAFSLSLTARTDRLVASPGDTLGVTFEWNAQNSAHLNPTKGQLSTLNKIHVFDSTLTVRADLDSSGERSTLVEIPTDHPFSSPPYLEGPRTDYHYSSSQAAGCLAYHPTILVEFSLTLLNQELLVRVPLQFIYTDRVLGEVRENLRLEPVVSIKPLRRTLVLPNAIPKSIDIEVSGRRGFDEVQVTASGEPGWTSDTIPTFFPLDENTPTVVTGRFASSENTSSSSWLLTASDPSMSVSATKELFSLPHVPAVQVVQPAKIKTVSFPLKVTVTDVGFIPGVGDKTVLALTDMGLNTIEFADNLSMALLTKVPVIISGVRAFNTNHALAKYEENIYQWVKEGGTFVAQYNTASTLTRALGPYPISLARARVTDENARMTPLVSDHPVFHAPNTIGVADWAGWVQERGLHFPVAWDKRYTPLIACADRGEPTEKGSLLVAKYGKGHYIYCSLSLFRQLPAGVPGAYRLLANLLSL